jgi:hypothetical protein
MKTRKPLTPAQQHAADRLRTYLDTLPHGGVSRLATDLKTDPTYLCRLGSGDRPITADWVLRLVKVTPLQPHELRADLFDPPEEGAEAA